LSLLFCCSSLAAASVQHAVFALYWRLSTHLVPQFLHDHYTPAAEPPMDPDVREAADKLAEFVAKNGRKYEVMTRERNPGNTTFK
jgi:hypothetical protein